MGITINEMTVDDYEEAAALWDAAEGIGLHPDECDSRQGIARYLARNPGTCFVARDGAKLVGAVLCGHDGRRAYLNHLAVAKEYRRCGTGTALVERCTAAMTAIGIAKCNLFVFADNEAAVAFWHGLGWRCYDEFGVKVMTLSLE